MIAGTPIGLYDAALSKYQFNTLVIDEAGQCIEPLAWCIFPLADKIVLAGDHWQLHPTVLSDEATRLGLNKSILETAIQTIPSVYLLDTQQYRMRKSIGFQQQLFYDDALQTPPVLADKGIHLTFIDTAGSGYNEKHGPDGVFAERRGTRHCQSPVAGRTICFICHGIHFTLFRASGGSKKISCLVDCVSVLLTVSRDRRRRTLLYP